jgi:hypothetical protein
MYFFLKFAKREKMKNKILLTSVVAATYALPATRTSDASGRSYKISQVVLSLGATIKF